MLSRPLKIIVPDSVWTRHVVPHLFQLSAQQEDRRSHRRVNITNRRPSHVCMGRDVRVVRALSDRLPVVLPADAVLLLLNGWPVPACASQA